MATALHLAPRLLLVMLLPLGLIFFGVFFAAVTAERKRRNKAVRAMLGELEPTAHKVIPHASRYAYAIEQLQREQEQERQQLHFTQVRPIRFRSSHTGLSGKH